MKYQFNLNAAQLQIVLEALQIKSDEIKAFGSALLQSAKAQEAALTAKLEAETSEEVTPEVTEEIVEATTENETE